MISTLTWPVVNFVLYVILLRYLYLRFVPPLLKARALEIEAQLRQASATLQEAQMELNATRKRLANINSEKQELAQRLTVEADNLTRTVIAEAKARAVQLANDVERQAASELQRARQELKQEAILFAVELVKKRLTGQVTAEVDQKLRSEILQPSFFQ